MPKPTLCNKCNVKRASFGIEGGKKTRCKACKDTEMIDLITKRCEVCKKVTASFGMPDGKHTHCVSCKTEGMIYRKTALCQGCNKKQPSFGVDKTKRATHCVDCKSSEMTDVRTKKCEGCNLVEPSYGLPGGKCVRCVKCKTEDMICLNKKCEGCNTKQPCYGFEGKQPVYCASCKLDGMIDLRTKKCIQCNLTAACFGYEGEKYEHCGNCKKDGMINLKDINKKCKQEKCLLRGNIKYRGYCTFCFQHLFPNDPLCLEMNCKVYETKVRTMLTEHKLDFTYDKPIYHSGCDCSSRRRVDFWKLVGNTMLAIEVDENQHSWYDKKDEEIRYDDLFMHFSGKWIFIRFNPNKYKKGNAVLNPRMEERIPKLLKEIHKHLERIKNEENIDLVEIHKLYFNRE
jgi:hypothetical protein